MIAVPGGMVSRCSLLDIYVSMRGKITQYKVELDAFPIRLGGITRSAEEGFVLVSSICRVLF